MNLIEIKGKIKDKYKETASFLTKKISFIHPIFFNVITLILSCLTGFCFLYGCVRPKFFLAVVILIIIQMILCIFYNAVISENKKNNNKINKMINIIINRYSDIFIVAGIVLSPLCSILFGFLGLSTIFLVSYSGILGKALGVSWQECGPLDKTERMFLFIVFAGLQYLGYANKVPEILIYNYIFSYLEICMLMFFVVGQFTIIRRLIRIYKEIKILEN